MRAFMDSGSLRAFSNGVAMLLFHSLIPSFDGKINYKVGPVKNKMVETKLWSGQDWDVFGEVGFNLQVHQE